MQPGSAGRQPAGPRRGFANAEDPDRRNAATATVRARRRITRGMPSAGRSVPRVTPASARIAVNHGRRESGGSRIRRRGTASPPGGRSRDPAPARS